MATTKTTKAAVTSAKVEEVKATTTKAVAAKTEDTTKKAVAKTEDTTKKAVAKKAPAKKATTKKTTEKVAKKNELYVQFSGFEFSYDELLEKVKADYIAQTGKKTVTSTKLYVKPEDMKVYYVINDKFMGDVYLG